MFEARNRFVFIDLRRIRRPDFMACVRKPQLPSTQLTSGLDH